jgi:hypothetical protein
VGKPDRPDDYVAIQVGEWARRYGTIHVPWEIWKSLRPTSQEFIFYIQDYGRFCLEFDVPIGWLKA